MKDYRFCPMCGETLRKIIEKGQQRLFCEKCGWRYYKNPLPAVAAFVQFDEKILLIKRGIAPEKGCWALPSGFIEQNESPEQAVLRELKEETGIVGKVNSLLGIYNQPTKIYGDVLLLGYDIAITKDHLSPGSETEGVRFFKKDRLPKIPFASHRAIISAKNKKKAANLYVEILKSKITEAVITKTVLHYKGSMGIDAKIMKLANIIPGEKVQVLNYDNGERLETYAIAEKPGSGRFILYGPASLKGKPGQHLCILSYTITDINSAKTLRPSIVILDKNNKIKKVKT